MKKVIIFIVIVVMLAGVAAGLYFMGYIGGEGDHDTVDEHGEVAAQDSGHGAPPAAANADLYLPLDPPFVVNFTHRGTLRYLQISLEVMYHDQAILDEITARMPAIRNELILLFSDQEYIGLSTLEGKEQLRININKAVNRVLDIKETSHDSGEVYITNFIMQ